MKLRARFAAPLLALITAGAAAAEKGGALPAIQFRTERAGLVSINLYDSHGVLVRRLAELQRCPAGAQKMAWDGNGENGKPVPPGDYTWKGLFHEGLGLKLRGWVANGLAIPWPTPDGREVWGGDAGIPSAVAADAERVYLGWSMADAGKAILACDIEGRVLWSHRRTEGPSGCKVLAVDGGIVYVLGGLAGLDAEGGAIYRLDARTGKPVPWPRGKIDLTIDSLWPADSKSRPQKADAMAVRHNHIYLTFTDSEFLAVLDGKTGAYIDTVVGPPPGLIDVVATQTDLPSAPGKLVDADFAVVSMFGGVLGKALLAHDPFWVVTSEVTQVLRDGRISALTVMGDAAKFHRHMAFIGVDAPVHQVHGRPLLDIESVDWVAGKPGGRPLLGPWEPDAVRSVRGLAMDSVGRLWVAEGDGYPKRFSVWDTKEPAGKLVGEFFGPRQKGGEGAAIDPLDPDLMFAQGCEWRIDPTTGQAKCLGVVLRRPVPFATYGVGENGNAYLVAAESAGVEIYERLGDGDYKLRASLYADRTDRISGTASAQPRTFAWADENGDGVMQAEEQISIDGDLRIGASAFLQDLTFCAATHPQGEGRIFKVASWSPCGAPRYDLSKPVKWEGRVWLSADQRLGLEVLESARSEDFRLSCRELPEGRERWRIAAPFGTTFDSGAARLPAPMGNVWLMVAESRGGSSAKAHPGAPSGSGAWTLVNEDGFTLGHLFAPDAKSVQWPKGAVPGADMSNAASRAGASRLTQGADGKLYLQAGDSAVWNLEVTGLDKVRELGGGQITAPAVK